MLFSAYPSPPYKEGKGWGLGTDRCGTEGLCPPAYTDVGPGPAGGFCTCCMATVLGSAHDHGEPSHIRMIPKTLDYLSTYALVMAYMESLRQGETLKAFRLRTYVTLRTMSTAGIGQVTCGSRNSNRQRIGRGCGKTYTTWSSEVAKPEWYTVIHDILPTNERLHRIQLVYSDLCRTCGDKDTSMHRLTECGEGKVIWDWTRKRIACMLRTDPCRMKCVRNYLEVL